MIVMWVGISVLAVSFGISLLAAPLSARVAYKFSMVDLPGRHKTHAGPVPLLGGCGIFAAVLGPALLALSVSRVWAALGIPAWVPAEVAVHIPGLASKAPIALGLLAGATAMHVVGLVDDKLALGPWLKLTMQLLVATATVLLCGVRILTVAGPAISVIVSILWIVAITNAFNFLDNMDGLAAGVAAIVTTALLAAALSLGQLFISAWLLLLLGALLGFLPYNYPPAKIYMGDAGSLVIGYLLAVMSAMTTYVRPGESYYAYGIFVPFVLMAIPIYDTISVMTLRIRERRSPMVGDRSHFSHRLVRRGMSVRTAVKTIYLCTAATAIAASLLVRVDRIAAVLVFAQVIAILLILALLEFGDSKG